MMKIESNMKINGRHWGLQFADGIAYTANASLAAKLLLKGYVVTDQPDQPVAGPIDTKQELSPTPLSHTQEDIIKTIRPPEQPEADLSSPAPQETAKAAKPKTTKPRKKVTADAADAG